MSFEVYKNAAGVNWSLLKFMRESPMAYLHAKNNPQPDKKAFALGRAVHCAVLEPEKFAAEIVMWNGGIRRGGKWDEFQAENKGKTILLPAEMDQVIGIAGAVLKNKDASEFIRGGVAEKSIYWKDPETGLDCKARPDMVHIERRILVDLKTTRSVDGRKFGACAEEYGYLGQMAHYEQGCIHAHGFTPERQIIVAVETLPPYDVGVFEIAPDDRQESKYEVGRLLRLVKDCQESDVWPGKNNGVQALQRPAWVYMADDDGDLDLIGE